MRNSDINRIENVLSDFAYFDCIIFVVVAITSFNFDKIPQQFHNNSTTKVVFQNNIIK